MQQDISNYESESDKVQTGPKEGDLTIRIENETSKLPSSLFLPLALGSIALSFCARLAGSKSTSLFVGQWVSPFLLLGIYNKLVKLEGHDAEDRINRGL